MLLHHFTLELLGTSIRSVFTFDYAFVEEVLCEEVPPDVNSLLAQRTPFQFAATQSTNDMALDTSPDWREGQIEADWTLQLG